MRGVGKGNIRSKGSDKGAANTEGTGGMRGDGELDWEGRSGGR